MKKHKNAVHMPRINTDVIIGNTHNIYCDRGAVRSIDTMQGILHVEFTYECGTVSNFLYPFKYSTARRRWERAIKTERGYIFSVIKEFLVY